jgi:hypothetical protein
LSSVLFAVLHLTLLVLPLILPLVFLLLLLLQLQPLLVLLLLVLLLSLLLLVLVLLLLLVQLVLLLLPLLLVVELLLLLLLVVELLLLLLLLLGGALQPSATPLAAVCPFRCGLGQGIESGLPCRWGGRQVEQGWMMLPSHPRHLSALLLVHRAPEPGLIVFCEQVFVSAKKDSRAALHRCHPRCLSLLIPYVDPPPPSRCPCAFLRAPRVLFLVPSPLSP